MKLTILDRRTACPRCVQDWLLLVRLVELSRRAIFCPDCNALWSTAEDVGLSTFEDYGTFMMRHGRQHPDAKSEIEIEGPLLRDSQSAEDLMTLDRAILGPNGAPVEEVSLRLQVHENLIAAANATGASLLVRMEDFYADAEYAATEMPALLAELDAVGRTPLRDAELSATLAKIKSIVETASRTGRAIAALADEEPRGT